MVNKEKLLANAQKFISKGQISKAIGEYETLVGAFPRDVRNRQKLAELLSRDKRDEEALKEYEAVAKNYTETGFYLKAIAVFKQMQKIDPSRLDIYHRLAELNEKQGLVGNALTEYRNLVAYYEQHQRHQEAADVLEKMLELDPDNLNLVAKIAECCMALDQNDQAFEKFQAVVGALVAKGDHAKVIKLYDHFLGICPEEGTTRLPLARALLNSGSSSKALQILKNLVKHSPDDAEINRCLADAYVAVEDFANARLTLSHLLKHREDDLDLREYFLRVCLDAGEAERARDRLEEWKDSFVEYGRLAALRDFYNELQAVLPGDPLVAATLADVHEALGDSASLETPEAPEKNFETAANAVLEMAIDDVEALDMVGEEASPDVEVPALDKPVSEEHPAEELELDLDLDLDFDPPTQQIDDVVPSAEPDSDPVGESEPEPVAEADEDLEIEMEVNLDDLDDFELGFDGGPTPAEADAEADADHEPPLAAAQEADDFAADAGDQSLVDGPGIELELPEVDGLDGFVTAEQLEPEAAEQAELSAADEDWIEYDHPEPSLADDQLELADGELDLPVEGLEPASDELELSGADQDSSIEGLELADEDLDSPAEEPALASEELSLAGEELDLSGAELGHAGDGTSLAAEEFFTPDEELSGPADDHASGAAPAETTLAASEELEELEALEELDELEELAAGPDAGSRQIEAELEEVQFYLQQGLFDDAERLVHTLIEARPERPELQAELAGIEQARLAAASEVPGDAFVDLMADLQDDDLLEATGFLDSFAESGQADDDLTQKLVSELDSADTESHYNLGIAYKEMGLYDEAIAEFDKAAQDPARHLDCITLTGQCHLETGAKDEALAVFKSGLANPGLSDLGRMTLNFELGMLHQNSGELLEALEYFQLVAEQDTFFRDVSELIRSLRKQLGLDDSNDDGPQGNRDRVSYV